MILAYEIKYELNCFLKEILNNTMQPPTQFLKTIKETVECILNKDPYLVAKAIHDLENSKELKESAEANWLLGFCYGNEIGITKNLNKMCKYYQVTVDMHYARGQVSLGECYQLGIGVNKDIVRSITLYKLAENQKYPEALFRLNDLYVEMSWFDRSSFEKLLIDQKHANECQKLAEDYLNLAAKQGSAKAQLELGMYYYEGFSGYSKDYIKAVKFLQLSADQGHAEALHYLGRCYSNGRGVVRDKKKSTELFKQAEDQGYETGYGKCGDGLGTGLDGVKIKGEENPHKRKASAMTESVSLANSNADHSPLKEKSEVPEKRLKVGMDNTSSSVSGAVIQPQAASNLPLVAAVPIVTPAPATVVTNPSQSLPVATPAPPLVFSQADKSTQSSPPSNPITFHSIASTCRIS